MSPKKRQRDPLCTLCGTKISLCKAVPGCGQIWELVGDAEPKKVWRHKRCGEEHIQTENWGKKNRCPRVKQCCAGQCSERGSDGEVKA